MYNNQIHDERNTRMKHDEIFTYVLAKFNIALGVDEIIHIVTNNLFVDQYVSNKYFLN